MTEQQSTSPTNLYARLPKVDLHRHLEGSIRLKTLQDLARDFGLRPPTEQMVQVSPSDALTSSNFLSKFQVIRQFFRSPEAIERIAHEAVADAALDGVRYLELRFTPVALSRVGSFSLADVMDWVCRAVETAGKTWHISTRLIASVNRHEGLALAEQVAALAVERRKQGIVALDLAGDEAAFDAGPFLPIFRTARAAGLHIAVHAGEWSGAANVRQALQDFQAERIGHGVRVLEDGRVTELAAQHRSVFEVCLTSNYHSGVVGQLQAHPFAAMRAAGLRVTLNTDDPGISNIRLSHEYQLAQHLFGLSWTDLHHLVLEAGSAAFLPEGEKRSLLAALQTELAEFRLPEDESL